MYPSEPGSLKVKHYLLMVMYESNALEVKLVKISCNVQMSANGKNIFNGKKCL